MIKKLFLIIVIIFVSYIVLIFLAPNLAAKIEDSLWINWFNQAVYDFREKIGEIYTNLPSQEEVKNAYETTKSWAIQNINKIKDSVDDVRWWLNESVDKYNEIKNEFEEKKWLVEEWINTIKEIGDTINNFSSSGTTNSWTTN